MDPGVDALIELDLTTNRKDYPNILRQHATVVVYGRSSSEPMLALWLMRNSITLRFFLPSTTSALPTANACLAELDALLHSNRLIHSGTTLAIARLRLGT